MPFRFSGIDHVQLAAPRGCEGEARRFFGELLGWDEIEKPSALRERGGVWFRCGPQDQVHIGVQEPFAPALKAHPAFDVVGLQDLKAHLEAHGVKVLEDDRRAEERIERFYAHDPFGNRLEFMERPAG
jgi:catechol 2,3-dioxygenase-like lactoylglutathione lyase family enzyme